MTSQVDAYVGREQELRDIGAALTRAQEGFGSTWFLVGDAGIGKTRTTEEASRVAASMGFLPLFGRCWEAGGAPSFWPWVTLLRTLFRGRDPATQARWVGGRAPILSQLLPELLTDPGAGTHAMDTHAARFQLMDAVASCLADAAIEVPLVILLEDLHAADPSSVTLLDFVSRQVPSMRVVLIGTYRPVALEVPGVGETLARVCQRSTTIKLKPLLASQVAELVAFLLSETPSSEALRALQVATDGNPLFVVEMCRWSHAHGGVGELAVSRAVPPNLRRTIRERLGMLPAATCVRLEFAAVIGREFRPALLHDAEPSGDPRTDLLPALDAAILIETLPGQWRFAHGLIRDALYWDLDLARREALHLCIANALEPYAERQPWAHTAELSHHLQHSGPMARERALDAAQRAAEFACQQLGFDEACAYYRRALDVLDVLGNEAKLAKALVQERRCRLLLALGNAQIHAGHPDGKSSCKAAAAIARELGSASLLAEAALEYGAEFTFALVDPGLVKLLEEALQLLPETPGSLRARVLARLAAALQPANDPRGPIEMAQRAVEMARATATRGDLLRTLRSAGSAMMDLAHPRERLSINREHAELAQQQGDAVEVVRAEMRMVFDHFELGDVALAADAIARAKVAADALGYERFRWRALALCSMLAAWRGEFARAKALRAEALEVSLRASDPNGPRCAAVQRFGFAFLEGEADHQGLIAELALHLEGSEWSRAMNDLLATTLALKLDLPLPVNRARFEQLAQLLVGSHDLWLLDMLASCASILPRALLQQTFDALLPEVERFASGGLAAMLWERPVARALALLADALGQPDRADRYFSMALEQLVAQGGLPHEAWTAYEWATSLARRADEGVGRSEDEERRRELLKRAQQIASTLGIGNLVARCQARLAELETQGTAFGGNTPSTQTRMGATAESVCPMFTLQPMGDFFRLERAGQQWQVRDSKGVRWLWRLINEPGRQFHVLDLSSTGPVDGGDGGEILDAQSKRAYRERLDLLQVELTEAEANNDWARAERARQERELLTRELKSAFGLGGKERRSGSALERARVNVQRRLKDAINRIAQHDAHLGRHLERSVRTGTYCTYQPE